LAIVALLRYFFLVKERKRTAIECSFRTDPIYLLSTKDKG